MLPILLLVLFPIFLMFDTRLGLASLAIALVLLYRNRVESARQSARRPSEDRPMKPWKDPWNADGAG